MKIAIFIAALLMVAGTALAQECKKPNEKFYVAELVTKLEAVPASKWRIDYITKSIWIYKKRLRIEIRKNGDLTISRYSSASIPMADVTRTKTKALYKKVTCIKKSLSMKLVIRALKAFGIDWKTYP